VLNNLAADIIIVLGAFRVNSQNEANGITA